MCVFLTLAQNYMLVQVQKGLFESFIQIVSLLVNYLSSQPNVNSITQKNLN